jgi:hypothetical protein
MVWRQGSEQSSERNISAICLRPGKSLPTRASGPPRRLRIRMHSLTQRVSVASTEAFEGRRAGVGLTDPSIVEPSCARRCVGPMRAKVFCTLRIWMHLACVIDEPRKGVSRIPGVCYSGETLNPRGVRAARIARPAWLADSSPAGLIERSMSENIEHQAYDHLTHQALGAEDGSDGLGPGGPDKRRSSC